MSALIWALGGQNRHSACSVFYGMDILLQSNGEGNINRTVKSNTHNKKENGAGKEDEVVHREAAI